MKPFMLIIDLAGTIHHVHDDELTKELSKHGTPELRRASYIEPTPQLKIDRPQAVKWLMQNRPEVELADYPDRWWADMLPSNGPVLGPFDTHAEAIAAEQKWLSENNLGLDVTAP